MSTLQEHILGFVPSCDRKLIDHITPLIRTKTIRKNDFLLSAGTTCRKLSFITRGICYKYLAERTRECVTQFYDKGDLAGDYGSFANQVPSRCCIKTLENVEVQELHYSDIILLYNTDPAFERISRKMTDHYFCRKTDRLHSFQHECPETRYLRFLRERPALMQQVPQYLIASYLGITPVGLSKIRSRLSNSRPSVFAHGRELTVMSYLS